MEIQSPNISTLESLHRSYVRFRLRYPVYFFHHLPKCGGTSVREALDTWFHVNHDYQGRDLDETTPPIDLRPLNSYNCVSGHFGHDGHFIHQRYPMVFSGFRAAHRYRVFTFMRDPLKMRCSLFRHDVALGTNTHPDMFSSIMTYNNYFARILGVDEHNWEKKLGRYFFIGNADDLQASFDILADLIGRPQVELPVVNTTERGKDNTVDSLSEQQKQEFMQANQLDYAIFKWACERLQTHQA